ncbi:MAG: class I SAM-dependent methyltransferase [Chitinophagaceae bacterium]|nr:class I SAM-dependent methyltransferase [Chitinophagaceae bacterium]
MKDNFSKQAGEYARYRPHYPPELFEFIIAHVTTLEVAWDCATGNGQSALQLARHFDKVFATDISQEQLDAATASEQVVYTRQPAEQTNFPDNYFDLITVSQALHWFNFDSFYSEVNRTGKPGSWLAVWMYSLLRITPEVDEIIERFHYQILGEYWDQERGYVNSNYTTIPFPFAEIATPTFEMKFHWSLEELEGYLTTWSALQKFIGANNFNPVAGIIDELRPHWKSSEMNIVFPLYLRMGKIEK